MSEQKQTLQIQIQNLLNVSHIDQNDKINLLSTILNKLLPCKQTSRSNKPNRQYNFYQLNTENQQIEMFSLEKSPIKQTHVNLQYSFQKEMPYNQSNQSQTLTNMHRLSSQMKGYLYQSEQRKHEHRKIKKQKIVEMIGKANDCINTLCEALHKAYSHLVAMRMGKSMKFQVESIYLTHLKLTLDQINRKLAQKMKTQDLIQFYLENLVDLKNKILKYETKFIFPQDQLHIPEPSKLFRVIVQS